ncbi:MAG: nucleotide exchange factor GrpE, partial [Candidatus Magasanikbacteria bacterium RIFOXYB1_FULL_40_15]
MSKDKNPSADASAITADRQGKEEVEELKIQCEEYKAGWMRAQADYQNLQKEVENRRSEWARMSEAQILEDFIPVYDHL